MEEQTLAPTILMNSGQTLAELEGTDPELEIRPSQIPSPLSRTGEPLVPEYF
jgi:hypothetical protein